MMNENFNLAYNISLNNFKIRLYHLDGVVDYVNQNVINSLIDQLNQCNNAREILAIVAVLQGITKVEIFDNNYDLLISYSLSLEE